VDVAGRITLGEGSSALRETLREMVSKNQKKILLNLGDVSYIDSSGIGELVSGFTTVTNSGGQLKLLNLNKRVKDLLQITKLYTVFDVHEDEGSRHPRVCVNGCGARTPCAMPLSFGSIAATKTFDDSYALDNGARRLSCTVRPMYRQVAPAEIVPSAVAANRL